MLRELREGEFEQVYAIMREAFPPAELRPYEKQKALLKHPRYIIFVIVENGGMAGFFALWNFDWCIYIEHFAINSEYRSGGIGGRALRELLNSSKKSCFLCVEQPKTDITKRRVAFYKRHGFQLSRFAYNEPAALRSDSGSEKMLLNLMAYPKKPNIFTFLRLSINLYRCLLKGRR